MIEKRIPALFILSSLFALLAGLVFGLTGSIQYIFPEVFVDQLNFTQTRPLHVTLVISWIFAAAMGGIYYYIQVVGNRNLVYPKIAFLHFSLFIVTGLAIIYCYLTKQFSGREYFEYPPILAIPVLITWILFTFNFVKTLKGCFTKAPVYIWMWSTGVFFFLVTFIEANLWNISFFRDNIVRDVTIQWKAIGSMVGSWNMLVYGTGFYLMEKISGNNNISRSKSTFFFYFLGLTNLLFNWGHHTYIVPASPYIKNVSYIISMTELLILGSIIRNWSKSLSAAKINFYNIPYRFLFAADVWIFLNLTLAIIISIPAINRYTHGTHITVAHAMGSTIGINTMILLASLFYLSGKMYSAIDFKKDKRVLAGFWITNISLFIFWISLLGAGIVKIVNKEKGEAFRNTLNELLIWFHAFSITGIGVLIGLTIVTIPLFTFFGKYLQKMKRDVS